jgi:hypothetical protein
MKIIIFIFVLQVLVFAGCDPKPNMKINEVGAINDEQEKLNVFIGDKSKSKITSILLNTALKIYDQRVSAQKYLGYDVPVVVFKKSDNANYVRILRCPRDIVVGSKSLLEYGLLEDVNLMELVTDDVVYKLKAGGSCTYLPVKSGSSELIIDYWAKSGSWAYIIIPCVHPGRIELNSSSQNNCSKYFVVTYDKFEDNYVSKIKEKAQRYYDKSKQFADETYKAADKVSFLSKRAVASLDECSEREHLREVGVVAKKAALGMASAAIDFALEYASWDHDKIKTFGGGPMAYWKGTGKMDKGQFLQAPGGFTFHETLDDLFASARDMPRTCTNYMEVKNEIEIAVCKMITYRLLDMSWKEMGDRILGAQASFSGEEDFRSDPNFINMDPNAVGCGARAFGG